jgi:hypothetical protein
LAKHSDIIKENIINLIDSVSGDETLSVKYKNIEELARLYSRLVLAKKRENNGTK